MICTPLFDHSAVNLFAGASLPLSKAIICAVGRALHDRLLPLCSRLTAPFALHQISAGMVAAPQDELGLRPSDQRKGSAGVQVWNAWYHWV